MICTMLHYVRYVSLDIYHFIHGDHVLFSLPVSYLWLCFLFSKSLLLLEKIIVENVTKTGIFSL